MSLPSPKPNQHTKIGLSEHFNLRRTAKLVTAVRTESVFLVMLGTSSFPAVLLWTSCLAGSELISMTKNTTSVLQDCFSQFRKKRKTDLTQNWTILGLNINKIFKVRSVSQPGVNFINILQAAFTRADPECAKKDGKVSSVNWHIWDLRALKLHVKHW